MVWCTESVTLFYFFDFLFVKSKVVTFKVCTAHVQRFSIVRAAFRTFVVLNGLETGMTCMLNVFLALQVLVSCPQQRWPHAIMAFVLR